MSQNPNTVSNPSASAFVGDLCCERLCNDAMQTPLYDINDDSDLGDIINDHADRAMTPADIGEFNEWAAQQNYPITSR